MRITKKAIVLLLAAILLVGLVGCNASSSAVNKEHQETDKGENAKKYIKGKFTALISKMNKDQEKQGYLSSEDFAAFKSEFNLIANATKSLAEVDFNGSDNINNNISLLKEDINSLGAKAAVKAVNRYKSKDIVYESTIMKPLNHLMQTSDVYYDYNSLNMFKKDHSDSSTVSMEKVSKDATSSINSIELSYKSVDTLKAEIKKRENNFNAEEVDMLNSIVQNLYSSLQNQVAVLNHFQEVYVDDGTTVEDKINAAVTDFNDSRKELSEFEESLGVEYQEE